MTGTLAACRRALAARLAGAGVEDAAIEARQMLQTATGLDAAGQAAAPERPVSGEEAAHLEAMAARRLSGEPLQHILGFAQFWTLRLKSDARALVPRADTGAVVRAALDLLPAEAEARVLDLGTGTGAILLAVLSDRTRARGVGVDASDDALALARENAAVCGLSERARFVAGDWTLPGWDNALGGPFDLVVSNPPYIRSAEIAGLAAEVRRDPRAALDGGADGLDAYRRIVPALTRLLRPGGAAVLETGHDQSGDVRRLADGVAGVEFLRVETDLEGRPRAAIIRRAG